MIVTVCDRQSLNSMRDDVLIGPDETGVVEVNVIVIVPPPGQLEVSTFEKPPPAAAVITMLLAWVSVAPMMLCAATGLNFRWN